MYRACVQLKVLDRQVKPGESVPEAEHWSESVRRAHLNLGWIKKHTEAVATTIVEDKKPNMGAAKTPVVVPPKTRARRSPNKATN